MTVVEKLTGATSCLGNHWKAINWQKVEAEVKRLQMRIAKAVHNCWVFVKQNLSDA